LFSFFYGAVLREFVEMIESIRRWFHFALILSAMLFFTALTSLTNGADNLQQPTASIHGDIFKACLVAYQDFEKILNEAKSDPPKLAQLFSKIENYDIDIYEEPDSYRVVFHLKLDLSEDAFGGGARYTIRKTDYRIVDKKYFK
jgi:hypothetical protein